MCDPDIAKLLWVSDNARHAPSGINMLNSFVCVYRKDYALSLQGPITTGERNDIVGMALRRFRTKNDLRIIDQNINVTGDQIAPLPISVKSFTSFACQKASDERRFNCHGRNTLYCRSIPH